MEKISIYLINKCGAATSKFSEDANSALALLRSKSNHVYHHGEKHLAVSVEQAKQFFEKEGVKTIEIYAVCGMLNLLSIPETLQESHSWDEKLFRQVTEMLLRLGKEPSVKGLSKHLVLYGQKIQ